MLLDQTFHLEKGRKKIPFVSCSINRICQGFIVVERLQEGIEALNSISDHCISAFPMAYTSLPRLVFLWSFGVDFFFFVVSTSSDLFDDFNFAFGFGFGLLRGLFCFWGKSCQWTKVRVCCVQRLTGTGSEGIAGPRVSEMTSTGPTGLLRGGIVNTYVRSYVPIRQS